MSLRAAIALATVVLLAASPASAQDVPAELGSFWLDSGGTPPEGLRNPRTVRAPVDRDLLTAGVTTVALGYVGTVVSGFITTTGSIAGWYYENPCFDGAIGVLFVPVLGPWLNLAVLDQCSVGETFPYRNSDGGIAYHSRGTSHGVPISDMHIAVMTVFGVAQGVGLTTIVLGLVGTHAEIGFELGEGASIELDPIAMTVRGRF